jgi:hypothetical protein
MHAASLLTTWLANLIILSQETLAGDLVEAQQEQATLSSQLLRVSQDRDRLAAAVSTAHIRYNKQLESLRERLRTYEEDPGGQGASKDTTTEASSNTAAEMARLEAEATRLRSKLDASVLQAKQADAKCQALTAAHEQQLAAARREAEEAKSDAKTAAQNAAILCDDPPDTSVHLTFRIRPRHSAGALARSRSLSVCSVSLLPTRSLSALLIADDAHGREAKLQQSDEEAIAARAVAAEWKQSQEQLNEAKANEPPTVDVGLLRDRLEEAHRHVRNVLATAIR